jgi:hypothetical protein
MAEALRNGNQEAVVLPHRQQGSWNGSEPPCVFLLVTWVLWSAGADRGAEPSIVAWENTMTDRHWLAPTCLGLAFGTALLASLSGASARTSSFEGNWSVLVITESGTCDRAYRYAVRVADGAVRYSGEAGVDVSGRVDDKGRVRVTIGRGEQRAEGTGQLGADSGSGTWSGRAPNSRCQGRWEAEKR